MISFILSMYTSIIICDFGYCRPIPVNVAVIAVTTCESGDAHNYGTIDWEAISPTHDTGAFQFNDRTWHWLTGRTDRAYQAPQSIQLAAFYKLWDNGYGWRHWNPSKPCWGEWLYINSEGRAVPRSASGGPWGVH